MARQFAASDVDDGASGLSALRSAHDQLPSQLYIPGIEGVKRHLTVRRTERLDDHYESRAGPGTCAGTATAAAGDVTDYGHHVTQLGGRSRRAPGPLVAGGDENDAALVVLPTALRTCMQDVKLLALAYVAAPQRRMQPDTWFITRVADDEKSTLPKARLPDAASADVNKETAAAFTISLLLYLVTNPEATSIITHTQRAAALAFGLSKGRQWRIRDGIYTSLLELLSAELPTFGIDISGLGATTSGGDIAAQWEQQWLVNRKGDRADTSRTHANPLGLVHLFAPEDVITLTAPLDELDVLPTNDVLLRTLQAGHPLAKAVDFSCDVLPCWLVSASGTQFLPEEDATEDIADRSHKETRQLASAPQLLAVHQPTGMWFLTPVLAREIVACQSLAYLLQTEVPEVYAAIAGRTGSRK